MNQEALFIYSDQLLSYRFSKHHPFNQKRLLLTVDLLRSLQSISKAELIQPRMATDEELSLYHDHRYIEAVKRASSGKLPEHEGQNFGIGTDDTPTFPGMHEASCWIVGGTLTAVDLVMSGKAKHALHLGGGLHHAHRSKASGFCVYNDIVIAIQHLQKNYQARVLYVDTDAHHGDGVQWAFYDSDQVCTLSIHETGKYLFPGTGDVHERGIERGYGYSFNIPLEAFSEDDSFLDVYSTAFQEIAEYFQPDVIVTQNGVDAHHLDPLTHLSTTMRTYREIPKLAHQLAHQYCDGKWIAVGGGGYDIWRVVPRAWALIWLEMKGIHDLSNPLPTEWIETWQLRAPTKLIDQWEDPEEVMASIPRRKEIEKKNRAMTEQALLPIRRLRKIIDS